MNSFVERKRKITRKSLGSKRVNLCNGDGERICFKKKEIMLGTHKELDWKTEIAEISSYKSRK